MEQTLSNSMQKVLGIVLAQISCQHDAEPWTDDEEVAALTAEWLNLSDAAQADTQLMLQRLQTLDHRRQIAVYLKGARDCVYILQELGVL